MPRRMQQEEQVVTKKRSKESTKDVKQNTRGAKRKGRGSKVKKDYSNFWTNLDGKEITVFFNDEKGYTTTSISKKEKNGEYVNAYMFVNFSKKAEKKTYEMEIDEHGRCKLIIKNGWLTSIKGEDGDYNSVCIFINDIVGNSVASDEEDIEVDEDEEDFEDFEDVESDNLPF